MVGLTGPYPDTIANQDLARAYLGLQKMNVGVTNALLPLPSIAAGNTSVSSMRNIPTTEVYSLVL